MEYVESNNRRMDRLDAQIASQSHFGREMEHVPDRDSWYLICQLSLLHRMILSS